MKVCHCTLPYVNPEACKNCYNNSDQFTTGGTDYQYEDLIIICKNCNFVNYKYYNFCSHCGKELNKLKDYKVK